MSQLVTLGWEALSWIEHYLRHGPGDVQGQPVELDDDLAGFLLKAYELRPRLVCADCGKTSPEDVAAESPPWRCGWCRTQLPVRRKVNEAVLSAPKGRAKSELAGMVACFEALGGCRFVRWDGERPVGAPVTYPFIRCLATEECQSDNTYANVAYMLHPSSCSDELRAEHGVIDAGRDWQTSTRVYVPGGGEIRPSTASSAAKDGGKESFAVGDEIHLYVTSELRAMYSTVARNLTKRLAADPWMLNTTTMYRPGQGSIAEQLFESAGKSGSLLIDHRQASRGLADVGDDVDAVEALLVEAYGAAAARMDLRRTAEAIVEGRLKEPERYFLNRAMAASESWIDVRLWDAREDLSKTVRRGEQITLGFDGSLGTADPQRVADSTALRGCRCSDGHLFTVGLWEAPGPGPWEPPRAEVDAVLAAASSFYDVVLLYADPAHWQTELGRWAGRYGGHRRYGQRIVEWWTNRDIPMAAALERLHTDVTTGGVTHDGDPRVRAHYANARKLVKRAAVEASDPDGRKERILIRKETPKSEKKIDAVVADALALEARADAYARGLVRVRSRVPVSL